MKRIVLVYGLIAGAILAGMMFATMPFMDRISNANGMLIGYASMVLAFLLVFFGIRSYRDNVAGGAVSFGRAFTVGALITLVASACYVAAWQIIYYGGLAGGDYLEQYAEEKLERQRAAGATDEELAAERARMDRFAELYQNPIVNAGFTLLEVLPVGLVMTLVAAGILRRGSPDGTRGQPVAV